MRRLGLAFILAATLCAQTAPDREPAIFAGVVRDSVTHLPIPKASIRLTPLAEKQPGYLSESDAAGAFRFQAIVPGDYRVQTRGRGFAESATVAAEEGRLTDTLHISAAQTIKAAIIELDPEAVVTGRVSDSDGEPVANAVVFAIMEQWQRGFRVYKIVGNATANDRGEYRLKVLPGRYYLKALPQYSGAIPYIFTAGPGQPEMQLYPIVYPNALTIEGGSPIDVGPGQQLGGISFKLRFVTTYHVRGTVKLFAPPAPRVNVTLSPRNGDRSRGALLAADVGKDGVFDVKGVLPGSYWLELIPQRYSPTGRMPIDVADRDVNQVKLESIPQFDIRGRVRFEPETDMPLTSANLHIDWLNWLMFNFSSAAKPSVDGAFVFPLRPAGEHVITLTPDHDFYIQSVSYNQREADGGRIDFTNGAAGEVDVVLATGTGEVDGTVTLPVPPGSVAILVSASGITGNTGARSAAIDAAGHLQFQFVPPGRYFVFAAPHFDEGLWQNADFIREIRENGVAVEVTSKGNVTAQVTLVSKDVIEQAAAKVPR